MVVWTSTERADKEILHATEWNDLVYNVKNKIDVDGSQAFSNYIDITEHTVPGTPSTNVLRLYTEDVKGFSFFSFKDDTGMVRKLVRDSVFVGKNVTLAIIPAYSAVYASGSANGVPTLAPALANAAATMPAVGITLESIAIGAYGRVMQVGLIEGVDTSAWVAGTVLYVSETAAGSYTATAPVYPYYKQEMATILVSDATVGTAQVIARPAFNIDKQKCGATTLVSDGGTITHGWNGTPTWVVANPSISGEFVSVTAIGAADFTVAIKKHDGSAGTQQTIYWCVG